MAAVMIRKITLLPVKTYLPSAYPAIPARAVDRMPPPTA